LKQFLKDYRNAIIGMRWSDIFCVNFRIWVAIRHGIGSPGPGKH
jgi:hypothetical protein